MLFSSTLLFIHAFPTVKMTLNFSQEIARENGFLGGISFPNSLILIHFLTKRRQFCNLSISKHQQHSHLQFYAYSYSIKIIFLTTNMHQETSSKIAHLFICKESKHRGA